MHRVRTDCDKLASASALQDGYIGAEQERTGDLRLSDATAGREAQEKVQPCRSPPQSLGGAAEKGEPREPLGLRSPAADLQAGLAVMAAAMAAHKLPLVLLPRSASLQAAQQGLAAQTRHNIPLNNNL